MGQWLDLFFATPAVIAPNLDNRQGILFTHTNDGISFSF